MASTFRATRTRRRAVSEGGPRVEDLDLVYVLDPRFEGGASTAVAAELDGLAEAPNPPRVGIMMVKAHLLGLPWPSHPGIRRHIESGFLRVVWPWERLTAQLALVHHPVVFANLPRARLPLRAGRAILVLHHPMVDAKGARQYDLDAVCEVIAATLAPEVLITPVSPVVRRSLRARRGKTGVLVEEDWINLIAPEDWPFDPDRAAPDPKNIVLGRHARPDPSKWPDTLKEATLIYGAEEDDIEVRVLGAGDFLQEKYGKPVPGNWRLLPFEFDGVQDFLAGLDFYVYYHDSAWSEAFGRTILEALAMGCVSILPPHFRDLFGDAALYAKPEEVLPLVRAIAADPARWRSLRLAARRWVLENHAVTWRAADRAKLFGLSERPAPETVHETPAIGGRSRAPVLFVSTNGIGVGHLTQQMAIADRLPRDALQPVFASMSFSLKVAADAGYPVFYLPHHRHLGAGHETWNTVFAEELYDLIRHLQPALLAYDGTAAFGGLIDALDAFPDLVSLWVRRAMWREIHRDFLDASDAFTGVIEPGELPGDLDFGPTRDQRINTHVTEPVLHIDPAARHDRAAARRHYGFADDDLVVALQMGSGANFETADLRAEVIRHLLRHPKVRVLDIVSPLATLPPVPEGAEARVLQLREFPSFLNSRAVDAAVGVAGYNAFHEQLYGGIPTLFIPNESPEMDSQLTRAQWAEVMGHGLCLRDRDTAARLDAKLAELLDPEARAAMRATMATLKPSNGAAELAGLVADHAGMVRTDRFPWDAYPR